VDQTELNLAPFAQNRYFEAVWALQAGRAIAVVAPDWPTTTRTVRGNPIATGVTTDLVGVWGPDPITSTSPACRARCCVTARSPASRAPIRRSTSRHPARPIHGTPLDLGPISGAGGLVWVGMPPAATCSGTTAPPGRQSIPAVPPAVSSRSTATDVSFVSGQSLLARWDGSAWRNEDIAAGTTMSVLFRRRAAR